MASPRLCSECGDSLAGRKANTKTCSAECRSKRSRRLRGLTKSHRAEALLSPEVRELAQVVRGERGDVVDEVVKEELRPVVREAITEDTMRAVADLIALAPAAVSALREDLASDDATIRQRAYTLVTKYTIGHPAIVRPPEEESDKQLVVHFNIPRPDTSTDTSTDTSAPEIAESLVGTVIEESTDETRQCDMCGEDRPLDQFVSGSYRCHSCYAAQQQRARDLYSDA